MKRERNLDLFHESSTMKTDIVEKDGNYIMKVEIPGFEKAEIHAELVNDYLYVRAEKPDTKNPIQNIKKEQSFKENVLIDIQDDIMLVMDITKTILKPILKMVF